jgi:hypothetical protein
MLELNFNNKVVYLLMTRCYVTRPMTDGKLTLTLSATVAESFDVRVKATLLFEVKPKVSRKSASPTQTRESFMVVDRSTINL